MDGRMVKMTSQMSIDERSQQFQEGYYNEPDTASLGLGSSRRAPSSMSLMEEGTRPFPRHAPNLANLRSYSIQASTGSLLSPSSSRKRPEFNQ
jgi:hypothetical protein